MKKLFLVLVFSGLLMTSFKLINVKSKLDSITNSNTKYSDKDKLENEVNQVKKHINKSFIYNKEIGFFIDMGISSGKNRFFVYNFKKDQIVDKGLVAHGSGSETKIRGMLKFSNIENSLSTSLGKYSVGKSYNGKFGKAYKLYGLDETNSNAYARNIVLHKYYDVPYEEQLDDICNSLGCPMVNEKFFNRIEKILDNSHQKIILDIYY